MISLVVLEIADFVVLTAVFALTIRCGYVVLAAICTYFMNSIGGLAWSMFAVTLSVGAGGGNSTLFATLMVLAPWIVAMGVSVALVIALYHAIESRIRHLASQS